MPYGKHSGSFKPGVDPRRHLGGPVKKDVIAANRRIKELLVKVGDEMTEVDLDGTKVKMTRFEAWCRNLWEAALGGEAWASALIAERTEGKVATDVNVSNTGVSEVVFRFARPDEVALLDSAIDDKPMLEGDVIDGVSRDVSE